MHSVHRLSPGTPRLGLPDEPEHSPRRGTDQNRTILSGSESDTDYHDVALYGQQDAAVLYARPTRLGKTRTFSEVRSSET